MSAPTNAPAGLPLINWFTARFARETAGNNLITPLEGFRLFCFLAVLLHHTDVTGTVLAPLVEVRKFTNFGVQAFFAVSGFILSIPFAQQALLSRPKVPLRQYYARRFLRIAPPLMLNLTILLLLRLASGHNTWANLAGHYLSGMTYSHCVFYPGEWNPVNFVTWSLELEVQFYTTMPLWASIFLVKGKRARRGVLAGAIALLVLLQRGVLDPLWGQNAQLFLPSQLQYFLVGFFLADIYLFDWKAQAPSRTVGWDIAFVGGGVLLTVALMAAHRHPGVARDLLGLTYPALMLAIMVGVFRGQYTARFLSNPWIYIPGGMCYSAYLWHAVVGTAAVAIFVKLTGGSTDVDSMGPIWNNVRIIVQWTAVAVGMFVAYAWLERPFMKRDWAATVGWAQAARRMLG